MKVCNTCNEEKESSEFHKRTISPDGLNHRCKTCDSTFQKGYRKVKPKGTRWTMSLYDKGLKYCRSCNEVKELTSFSKNKSCFNGLAVKCKVCKSKRDAEYRQKLRDNGTYTEIKRKSYLKNIVQHRKNQLDYNKNRRDYKKEYKTTQALWDRDPLAKLRFTLRNLIIQALKKGGYTKNHKTEQMLGAEFEVVKSHIESQFTNGMSWDNHGEWHVDHIVPLKSGITEDEIIELNHYTNLQPLWATTREINGVVYEGNLNKG